MHFHGRNAFVVPALTAALVFGATACNGQPAAKDPRTTPTATPAVKAEWRSVTVDGSSRTYLLVTPLALDRVQGAPLVVVLHNSGGDPEEMRKLLSFDEEAVKSGFVVAYPQTVNQVWNACCPAGPRSPDDVGFIRQLIDQLVGGGEIDPRRVFATGISSGGMMVHRLACELSDRLAAVASIGGELMIDSCSPPRPISVLELHGSQDMVVPISNASATMNRWAELDGCDPTASTKKIGVTSTEAWTGCRASASVALITVAGGGHIWFSPDASNNVAGPDPTHVIWTFFSRHAITA